MLDKDKNVLFFVVEFEIKKEIVDDESVYESDDSEDENGDEDG